MPLLESFDSNASVEKCTLLQADVADKGRKAWTFLAAASAANFFTYGFPSTFGVFREYYFRHAPFAGSQEVAYVGPIGLGLIQGLSPVLVYLYHRYPQRISSLLWLGAVLMVISTLGAAFSTTPVHLIITLGVLYGLGGSCVFAICLVHIDGWFITRRTLANGIFFSASSLAPACFSPVFSLTLNRYSPKVTLVGWAVFCAALSLISLPYIRPRQCSDNDSNAQAAPTSVVISSHDESVEVKVVTYRFWTQILFYILCVTTITQGLAHFLPALYIPTYATDLGVSQENAALLITYFNVVGIIVQPLYGAIVDKIGPLFPLLGMTLVGSASILAVWGLSKSCLPLVVTMLLFSASSGGFVVLRSSFASQIVLNNKHYHEGVSDLEKRINESRVSGVLMSLRGVATIASGFLGKAIVQQSEHIPLGPGYGSDKWKALILFVGVTIGATSLGSIGLIWVGRARERERRASDGEAST